MPLSTSQHPELACRSTWQRFLTSCCSESIKLQAGDSLCLHCVRCGSRTTRPSPLLCLLLSPLLCLLLCLLLLPLLCLLSAQLALAGEAIGPLQMLAPCRHIYILIYVADAQLLPGEDVAACHEGSHACNGTEGRLNAKGRQQGGGTLCIIDHEQDAQPSGKGRQGKSAGLKRCASKAAGHCFMESSRAHPAQPTTNS